MIRKVYLLLVIIVIPSISSACSCNKIIGFIKGAEYADAVVLGKIVSREFTVNDGAVFYDRKKLDEYFKENKGKISFYIEILTVEIIETIRGKKMEKTIKVFGGNFDSCWGSLAYLELNKFYMLSLFESFNPIEYEKPIGMRIGYELGSCKHSTLSFDKDLNSVTGVLRKKKKTMSYLKLKTKIR